MEAGPLRGKILVKQRKQPWGGQAAIYQIHRVSARLRLSSPSHSSLRPPCYEAIVWIFMKSDPYQQKQACCAISLARLDYLFSVATLHLVLLHSTVFLPLICISTSLSLALLLYLHLKNPFLMAFLQPFSYTLIHLQPCLSTCVWCSSKVVRCDWSAPVCENYMCANRMLLHGSLATCCQK